MRLRNKKTGEILGLGSLIIKNPNRINCESIINYDSLAELNEDWEDYKEPKNHYEILAMGAVMEREDAEDEMFRNQGQREISNYFGTKEEAEKAVEKLKAWKRLKDKGFRFEGWEMDGTIWFETKQDEQEWSPKYRDDLDLLFGGEE